MPGKFVKYEKHVGDSVKRGETILVLEAMKMYNNIPPQ
jgi:biotin carboxyl carrier protein